MVTIPWFLNGPAGKACSATLEAGMFPITSLAGSTARQFV